MAAGFDLLIYQVVAIATNLGCAPVIRRFRDQKILGGACGILLLTGKVGLYVGAQSPLPWLISAGLGAGIAMTISLSLSGMAQFVGYTGAAAGAFLFGLLHDLTGRWGGPLLLLIVSSFLVLIFATLAGRNRYNESAGA